MAVVEFRIEDDGESNDSYSVGLYVDGVALRELVRRLEEPQSRSAPHLGPPGDYVGVSTWLVANDPDRFLPVSTQPSGTRTILLGCGCGVPECHPLHASVAVGADQVVWFEFGSARPTWTLADLGPFVFDRPQYEASLQATLREVHKLHRRPL